MQLEANFAVWVFSSVAQYLKAVCDEANLPSIVEGVDDRTDAYMRASDRAEIRITGPHVKDLGATQVTVLVPANILITSRYDLTKNAYTGLSAASLILQKMSAGIPIFRSNPTEQIGCLKVDGQVTTHHIGQLNQTDKVKQYLVDAKYIGDFDKTSD